MLIVSLVLAVVMVAYVAYRIVTDRPDGAPRHRLYPLSSRPGDPSMPARGDRLGWAVYTLMSLGLLAFTLHIGLEAFSVDTPDAVTHVSGAAIMLGTVLLGAVVVRRWRNR